MRSLSSARWLGYDPIPSNDKDFGLLIRRFIDRCQKTILLPSERKKYIVFFRRYCIDIPNMQDVDLWRMQIILPCWMNMKTRHLFTTNLTIYRYRVARNYYLWKNIARWLNQSFPLEPSNLPRPCKIQSNPPIIL